MDRRAPSSAGCRVTAQPTEDLDEAYDDGGAGPWCGLHVGENDRAFARSGRGSDRSGRAVASRLTCPGAACFPAGRSPGAESRQSLSTRTRLPAAGRRAERRIRGPFTLPSEAYPGTQHTYWVYVPAQYDPAMPASLMIFNDGQAFMDMDGDAARAERDGQPDLPPRDPGDDRRVHQSRPAARSARADAAGLGRPRHQPADRVQLRWTTNMRA